MRDDERTLWQLERLVAVQVDDPERHRLSQVTESRKQKLDRTGISNTVEKDVKTNRKTRLGSSLGLQNARKEMRQPGKRRSPGGMKVQKDN